MSIWIYIYTSRKYIYIHTLTWVIWHDKAPHERAMALSKCQKSPKHPPKSLISMQNAASCIRAWQDTFCPWYGAFIRGRDSMLRDWPATLLDICAGLICGYAGLFCGVIGLCCGYVWLFGRFHKWCDSLIRPVTVHRPISHFAYSSLYSEPRIQNIQQIRTEKWNASAQPLLSAACSSDGHW